MNRIEILLKQYGPMLSGDLAKKYEKKYNASNEAARKAISRARSPIQKLNIFHSKRIKSFAIWKNNIIHLVTKNAVFFAKETFFHYSPFINCLRKQLWNYIQKLICNLFQFTHQENQRTSSVFKKHS